MKKFFLIILILILLLLAFVSGYLLVTKEQQKKLDYINSSIQISPTPSVLRRIGFQKIPHWEQVNHLESLKVFQKSCRLLKNKNLEMNQQTSLIHLNPLLFQRTCQIALNFDNHKLSPQKAKSFFETNFRAYLLNQPSRETLFTGYYSPNFEGRFKKDDLFRYPIYSKPNNLIAVHLKKFSKSLPDTFIYGKIENQQFIPFDDRASISKGSIRKNATVIAYVKNPMDAMELEIQGAGIIRTPEKTIHLNYAAQNGRPYEPIGKFLIQEGKISKKNMTMNAIREYFDQHPQEIERIFNKNKSYVFFKTTTKSVFYGYQNIPLTSGYSMAVDKNTIPIGVPIFLNTRLPDQHPFYRLMIAQDVGGAIKGPYRGDIYFGTQQKSMQLARQMQSPGQYWLLIPTKGSST